MRKSQFFLVAEAIANAKSLTWSELLIKTGLSHTSVSQVVHVAQKDLFSSVPLPGYRRKKIWSLSQKGKAAYEAALRGERLR